MSGCCHMQGNGASHLDVISFRDLRIPVSLFLKEHREKSLSKSRSGGRQYLDYFFAQIL